MKFRILTTAILGLAAVFALLAPSAASAQTQRCFPETGFCISGPIRTYWSAMVASPVFGYPITDQHVETVEGRTIPVQWFERDRLEIQNDGTITAGRLGARYLELQGRPWQQFPTEQPSTTAGCRYFDVTHFNVCDGFLTYWERNGGLPRFGYPISPVMTEQIEGRDYQVQYFERRRMEYHPENAAPYDILLGLLGRDVLALQGGVPPATDVLSGTAWQWMKYSDPTQQFTIDNPANYTIAFNNSSATIKADCNTVQATYLLGANNAITITPGASTRVACPEGSRGNEFVQKLGQVNRYAFQGDNLLLELPADGGTLTFARAGSTPPVTDTLTGTTWQWTKYSDPKQQYEIQNPSSYTIAFNNGTANIKADCNNVTGSYKLGADGALTITMGPTTLVACGENSRGDEFVRQLSQIVRYSMQNGTLLLEKPADSGTLVFIPAPAADPLSGTSWQWTKYSDPTQQLEIQNPANYTVAFNNGQLNIRADCNSVIGSYKVGTDGALTITLGPTTLVACGDDSHGDLFVQKLSQVSRYSINGTTLLLELPADGGTLTFAKR